MLYEYRRVSACNMCGSSNYKVLGKRLDSAQGFNPKNKIGKTTTVLKCRDCGLIFANPIPIPQNFSDHYDINIEKYFDRNLKLYDENSFKSEINFFKSNYHAKGQIKSLDIGAGLGRVMKAMEREGFEAYGIEPSSSFYEFATKEMGVPQGRISKKIIEEAEYEDNFFDFISFSAVFEHLYDPNLALKKALAWLKPGGLIYVGVPSATSLNQMVINVFYKIRGLDYVSNISPMHPPFHIYEFTKRSFLKNAMINNYTVFDFKKVTFKTYFPEVLDKIMFPLIKLTNTGMNIQVWLKK